MGAASCSAHCSHIMLCWAAVAKPKQIRSRLLLLGHICRKGFTALLAGGQLCHLGCELVPGQGRCNLMYLVYGCAVQQHTQIWKRRFDQCWLISAVCNQPQLTNKGAHA